MYFDNFLLGVAYFNAKEGCTKCTCEGVYDYDGRYVIFNDTNAPANEWFMNKKNQVVKFIKASEHDNNISVFGQEITNVTDFFVSPFPSRTINICLGDITYLSCYEIVTSPDNIKCKLVAYGIDTNSEYLFIPLLHTLS
uniref:Uncharacterized protein n=1 Tax=Anopheles stephensi TaxID=30069 RepID=A0A182YR99_ANOST